VTKSSTDEVCNVVNALATTGEFDDCVTAEDVKAITESVCMRDLIGYTFALHHGPQRHKCITIHFGFDCVVKIATILWVADHI
jgi:hypothetical protein